jgi:hypothetical protein
MRRETMKNLLDWLYSIRWQKQLIDQFLHFIAPVAITLVVYLYPFLAALPAIFIMWLREWYQHKSEQFSFMENISLMPWTRLDMIISYLSALVCIAFVVYMEVA